MLCLLYVNVCLHLYCIGTCGLLTVGHLVHIIATRGVVMVINIFPTNLLVYRIAIYPQGMTFRYGLGVRIAIPVFPIYCLWLTKVICTFEDLFGHAVVRVCSDFVRMPLLILPGHHLPTNFMTTMCYLRVDS